MFVTCLGRIGRARSHPKSTGLGREAGGVAAAELKNRENNPMQSRAAGLTSIKRLHRTILNFILHNDKPEVVRASPPTR